MEWCATEIYKVINLYRQFELIWNYRRPNYKRTDLIYNAWREIAKEMKRDTHDQQCQLITNMVDIGVQWHEIQQRISAGEDFKPMDLDEFKIIYKSFINSVRRQECIHSIDDLVDCLERRDIRSECKMVTDQYPRVNQYQEQRLAEQLTHSLKINGVTTCHSVSKAAVSLNKAEPIEFTEKKRAAIYKILSQNIGNYWRSFGRELDICEGAMDEIEFQFPRDLTSRIYRILKLFEEDECHDPNDQFFFICRALDKCRRKDLRRKIESVIVLLT